MRRFLQLCALVGLPGFLGGCPIYPLENDELCKEAGYSIANRTYSCTANPELANQRYEKFAREFTCSITDVQRAPVVCYLECAEAINALSCDDVDALGNDIEAWLLTSPQCSRMFEELGPVAKPEDWEVSDCNPEKGQGVGKGPLGQLCTEPGGAPATLSVVHGSTAPELLVMEVDDACEEQFVQSIVSGTTTDFDSADGVVWRVRLPDGGLVTEIRVEPGGTTLELGP